MHIEMLVKEVRQEKNMTITALSRRSGVSAAHLSDIEKNFKSPSLLVMVRIAKALDVDITELYRVKW
jgi:transcriptional regulator with XRE-family HTH domain